MWIQKGRQPGIHIARIKRLVFLLALALAATLLFGAPAGATAPAWQVEIKVQAPDPGQPGAFIPVPGIQVTFIQGESIFPPSSITGDDGLARMSLTGQGLVTVYLEKPAEMDSPPWDQYVFDEHTVYFSLNGTPGRAQATITLLPRAQSDGSGGVRIQKLYTP